MLESWSVLHSRTFLNKINSVYCLQPEVENYRVFEGKLDIRGCRCDNLYFAKIVYIVIWYYNFSDNFVWIILFIQVKLWIRLWFQKGRGQSQWLFGLRIWHRWFEYLPEDQIRSLPQAQQWPASPIRWPWPSKTGYSSMISTAHWPSICERT